MIIHILICAAFVVGAVANIIALWILYKSSNMRNSKHVLLLRCLATNDLIAQFGMLFLVSIKALKVVSAQWQCVLYVLLRVFGIGSGCVAFIMAVERWLALTRPFFYQSYVTHQMVKKVVFSLWLSAALLTFLPIFGFGQYYKDGHCQRYRDATDTPDVIYAYLFLSFGTTLSICIVLCNILIICEIWRIGSSHRAVVRRCSRISVNRKYSTAEEISFAKLMATVCIIFIVCWMPQMISIPLAQFSPHSDLYQTFSKVSDLVMCAYFALDPYVYVLQQYKGRGRCTLPCSKRPTLQYNGNRSTSTSTTTTTAIAPTAIIIHLHSLNPSPENV